jgi:hypothetical protein
VDTTYTLAEHVADMRFKCTTGTLAGPPVVSYVPSVAVSMTVKDTNNQILLSGSATSRKYVSY